VENNTLSDIAEQLATGESPADKLDKLNKAEEERFRREECAGLSSTPVVPKCMINAGKH
jgi:filamentous hemagglutinin